MDELPRLRARISSLQEFRDLIRAMRGMAAARVQEAQGALAGIRGYAKVIDDAISAGVGLLPETDGKSLPITLPGGSTLIVVCSEHGFTGAFNELLLDRAETELGKAQQLGIIGQRGATLAAERGLAVSWSVPMATHVGGVPAVTRQVAERLAGVSTASIVFGRYQKGRRFSIETMGVLPLAPALLLKSDRRSSPLHHLAPDVLLSRLADEYLFAEITHAVMESLASENGARLRVMEAADDNIHDKLEVMHRREYSLRQESITAELLDVVTGAEAILGPSPDGARY
jgi:F-type H+-transporting ATPase subunit gamma